MMDKCKAFWHTILHWRGWKMLVHWKGWSAWLKWSGWRELGAWKGWKQLLFPKPVFVVLLTLIAALGLPWLFLTGRESSLIAYPLYCVSFYALVTLVARIVKTVPWMKKKAEADPVFRKLKGSEENRIFGIGMYVQQFINFVYGGFKIVSGIVIGSAWVGGDGIYNVAQGLIQLYQILRHKYVRDMKGQWKAYRQCGYMMILLHLTMTGMVFQMIHMGRHEASSEIMIIATATFTFYKLISTFISVAKDRKHKQPVESAVHFLDFSQALYNLFVLQVGLLWVFGGTEFAYQKLMNSLTGGAVCFLVCCMGIYMIWRSHRDMGKLEDAEGKIL